jgi:hypothetical protein
MNTSRVIKNNYCPGKQENALETYRKPTQTVKRSPLKRDFIEENRRNVSQKGKSNPKQTKVSFSKQKCETRRTSNTTCHQQYKSPNSNSKAGNQAAERLSQGRCSNKSPVDKIKMSETARTNMSALNQAQKMQTQRLHFAQPSFGTGQSKSPRSSAFSFSNGDRAH